VLRNRRIEAWRADTATEAKKAETAFRAGKLKATTSENVVSRLRSLK